MAARQSFPREFIDALRLLLQAGGRGKLTSTNSLDRKVIDVFPNAVMNLSGNHGAWVIIQGCVHSTMQNTL